MDKILGINSRATKEPMARFKEYAKNKLSGVTNFVDVLILQSRYGYI